MVILRLIAVVLIVPVHRCTVRNRSRGYAEKWDFMVLAFWRTSLRGAWRGEHRYWFDKYFHGDIGAGLGASHQTGWTGLVAKLIRQQGEFGTIQ